jgi:hypothetical protein
MKRIIPMAGILALLFACNQAEKKEIETLNQEILTLKAESFAKDSAINEFFKMLNEIESNLAIIKEKEQIISKRAALGQEMLPDSRERINSDINLINELMSKNRQSIRYLNNQVKGANFKIEEFEKRLQQTGNMLEAKDFEINSLKEQLVKLDFSIEVLNATLDTLSREKQNLITEVQRQTQELNAAWYAYGTKKELLENHIVEKVGGFLGLGKSIQLKSDLNTIYFTQIDISSTLSIPLFAKKPTMITPHPKDSYRFVENENGIVERLDISNPKSFWGSSRYLVVEVN